MRQFCAFIIALIVCVMLVTCWSSRLPPAIMPTLLPVAAIESTPASSGVFPIPSTASLVCAPRFGQPWSLWRATSQPTAVRALLVEQGAVWAGTPFGVYRVDPATEAFILAMRLPCANLCGCCCCM